MPASHPPEVTEASKPQTPPGQEKGAVPIVGIGASAGGLEALEQFLLHVPKDCGMAFVVVQHLDPNHKGMLSELLQRSTSMKVAQIKDRTPVNPDCVYVIPPNKDLSILHGVLHTLDPVMPRGQRLPIDSFFRALADDQQERSIGVILSGMGSDGTLGLRAIKENAGVVFVQSPGSAKFDSMPRSAIDAGLADVEAPVEELPGKIIAYLQHAPLIVQSDGHLGAKSHSSLEKVIILLRAKTGHDFSQYKRSTVYRRIERRMGLHQIDKIAAYVHFLQENPQELVLLFKELLIGVTSFFRDPPAWEYLKSEVIPSLLADRPCSQPLRAWTPGCSTGEEAYSLAMVFKEALDELNPPENYSLQIFATDLDRDAVDKARLGVYPANIAVDVSPKRLRRFFVQEDRGYRINKEIREMVVFAAQNVVMDAPFTKLDILTCRNLLIYLSQDLQKKLLPLFHYCLNPSGVLFLGSAETIGAFTDLFSPLEGKKRIYRRCNAAMRPDAIEFPASFAPLPSGASPQPIVPKPVLNLQALADQVLLQRYSPAAVLVNNRGDIIYISGRTGKYLEPAAGKANWNIFAMAREGLRFELIGAFQKSLGQKTPISLTNLTVGTNGGTQIVNVTVQSLEEPEALRGMVMIVFTDVATPPETHPSAGPNDATANRHPMADLESECYRMRELLQTTREEMLTSEEELKSTNEELQSTNEELQSTNEELQSTNEELTTSKEEMQSMNEELQTVNHELQSKLDELSRANNDMKNLLNSTDVAAMFLDDEMQVRRFTPQMTKLFKLIPSDIGRPITDIASNLQYPDLVENTKEVLRTLCFFEKRVEASDGRWFTVGIMPYRTQENVIDGVVVTFSDITVSQTLEGSLRSSSQKTKLILDSIGAAFFSLDNNLTITYFNPAAERLLHRKSSDVLDQYLFDAFPEAKGSIFEDHYRRALRDKAIASFMTFFEPAPYRGWYDVRVYPFAEGISVFFQISPERPTTSASGELQGAMP